MKNNLIKRYILTLWTTFFISSFFVLILLVSIGNLVSVLLRDVIPVRDAFIYHIIDLPDYFNVITPISCLVAGLFAVQKLKNHNELLAILASGFSQRQFMSLLFFVSIFVMGFQFLMIGFVDPFLKSKKDDYIQDSRVKFSKLRSQGLSASTAASGRIWFKNNDYFLSFLAYNPQEKALIDPQWIYYHQVPESNESSESIKVSRLLKGKKAIYQHGQIWKILQAQEIYDVHNKHTFHKITPIENRDVLLAEPPQDFLTIEADISILNPFYLLIYIQKLQRAGISTIPYQIIFFMKIVNTLMCLLFTFLGVTGIFTPSQRQAKFERQLAGIFIFALFYWFALSYLNELGKNALIEPILATFSVPIFFSTILMFYLFYHRKLRT
jgi:lipopolysaccharide export system permease protein